MILTIARTSTTQPLPQPLQYQPQRRDITNRYPSITDKLQTYLLTSTIRLSNGFTDARAVNSNDESKQLFKNVRLVSKTISLSTLSDTPGHSIQDLALPDCPPTALASLEHHESFANPPLDQPLPSASGFACTQRQEHAPLPYATIVPTHRRDRPHWSACCSHHHTEDKRRCEPFPAQSTSNTAQCPA